MEFAAGRLGIAQSVFVLGSVWPLSSRAIVDCTMPVMQSEELRERYRERFGIEIVVPTDPDKEVVDRIIFDELVRRDLRDDSKRQYLGITAALQAQGARGVILGCTEIFLLIGQDDLPGFPVFDTTELHVEATVAFALADAAPWRSI